MGLMDKVKDGAVAAAQKAQEVRADRADAKAEEQTMKEANEQYKVKHLLLRDSGTMLSRTMNEYWADGWRFLFMVSHKDDLYLTFEKR
jgi:hypothetical protein